MNVTFSKKDENRYVAEFTAESNFAVHVERKEEGLFALNQSSVSGGKYANAFATQNYAGKVLDFDVVGEIYPKNIQLVSESEVESAQVIF